MRRPSPWRIRAAGLAARLVPALRARGRGAGGHDAYFAAMSAALDRVRIGRPTLVIDLARLHANITIVRDALSPSGPALRLAVKSLQAPELLKTVMKAARTRRLMAFNGASLNDIVGRFPDSDVLLGRPLPVTEAEPFVRVHGEGTNAAARPQWLIDTPRRLAQYIDLARARATSLRVNFEIDVGLHRGGFADAAALAAAVDQALAEPLIEIAGLMGYDPQVAAAAAPERALADVVRRYERFAEALLTKTGRAPAGLCLNVAGSLTWRLHLDDPVANEVTIGSAFLKPAHFDAPGLGEFQPALFLAEPVLKTVETALVPGLERLAGAAEAADPNAARGFFLYGGYGDARPVSPPGLAWSRLWGARTLLTGSRGVVLEADDFVFLRSTESEGVLTAFGDIAVFDGEAIVGMWPSFAPAA